MVSDVSMTLSLLFQNKDKNKTTGKAIIVFPADWLVLIRPASCLKIEISIRIKIKTVYLIVIVIIIYIPIYISP